MITKDSAESIPLLATGPRKSTVLPVQTNPVGLLMGGTGIVFMKCAAKAAIE